MELVRLKITASLDTSRYGAMSYGDILRTDAAYAKHLVDDCKAAVYIKTATQEPQPEPEPQTELPEPEPQPEPPPAKSKRTRKAKDQS